MTGTFVIKKQTNNVNYEYTNSEIIVNGNCVKDGTTDALQNINGSCYRKNQDGTQGEYFGNFTGVVRAENDIRYSMSEMSRRDANKVWDAIEEIEEAVTGKNEE